MRRQSRRVWVLLVAAALVTPALGQSTLNWPVGEFQSYRLDSGSVEHRGQSPTVVFEDLVTVKGTAWLRLYFGDVELQPGSFVRIMSLADNEVQELDADGLAMWHNTSAYFNGDAVYVELVAAPQTTNRILLERVAVQPILLGERGPCADDDCGICNTDDRVLSSELWSGRIMPVGCTGSVYNTASCVVSAGHCADGNNDDVIQFNVPLSDSDCYTNNPPVADQFPITGHQFVNGGVGNDWSVMTTGTNSVGQKPYTRYGAYRPIATSLGGSGNPVSVWGYGVDNNNTTRSQAQQTSSGTIVARYSTYYTYNVDVTYGNSGSGLIRNNEIIGIVTHCSFDCANMATRVDLAAFATARSSLCPGVDTSPPTPNPMTFSTAPLANSDTAIYMVSTTGLDDTPPVQYQFVTANGHARTWGTDASYTDTGLTPNTTYGYQVQARDSNSPPNVGSLSTVSSATTFIETPQGVSFGTVTSGSIVLNVVGPLTNLTVGSSGAYFNSTTSGGNVGISEWIQATTDAAVALGPNTEYTFRVRARNQLNIATAYSPTSSKYTLANVPSAPTLGGVTTDSMTLNVNTSANPAATLFAIQCTAPADAAWNNKYVDATGHASASAVWQADATWGTITVQGLLASTQYCFQVKARNEELIETAFSAQSCQQTLGSPTNCLGDSNCDDAINWRDIDYFVAAMSGQTAWQNLFLPGTPGCPFSNNDVNSDGTANWRDIDPLVALMNTPCP